MYDHRHTRIDAVNELQIPKVMIALAAGVDQKRVTDYVKSRAVKPEVESRISETIEAIKTVWTAFSPFRVELNSPELLAQGLRIAEEIKMQREMHAAQRDVEKMLSAM